MGVQSSDGIAIKFFMKGKLRKRKNLYGEGEENATRQEEPTIAVAGQEEETQHMELTDHEPDEDQNGDQHHHKTRTEAQDPEIQAEEIAHSGLVGEPNPSANKVVAGAAQGRSERFMREVLGMDDAEPKDSGGSFVYEPDPEGLEDGAQACKLA